jgi:hypothetical protein
LSVARLTHAIEFDFETPLAQHALSPANMLDAISIPTATRVVVVILIMVNPEIAAMAKRSNFFASSSCQGLHEIAAGTAASTVNR